LRLELKRKNLVSLSSNLQQISNFSLILMNLIKAYDGMKHVSAGKKKREVIFMSCLSRFVV